ncbi:MAG: hypothetical protein LBF49_00805 [Puniceicoccales bacterium]|nr:hypothetical protein [Puniceicoccales bacterium]
MARENYVNFYNGAKYLLTKYGGGSRVKALKKLLKLLFPTIPSPESMLIRDGNGRLTLPNLVPEGYRENQFTAEDLHRLENRMIEKNSSKASQGKSCNMVDAQGRSMPDVPFPELVGGKDILYSGIYHDETFPVNEIVFFPKEARENYRNYHTGINYLVKKYGSRRVNEVLTKFRTSWGPGMNCPQLKLAPTRNENGQEQLEDLPQGDAPMLAFNLDKDRLQEFENLIIENGKWNDNRALKVVGTAAEVAEAAIDTAGSAISLAKAVIRGTGIIDITAKTLSFASSAIEDCELGLEIRDNPASKDTIHTLKGTKAKVKTAQKMISLGQAMTTKKPDTRKTTKTAISFANSVIKLVQWGLKTPPKAVDKTISPPVILGKEEKLVYYADEENMARENFETFYNAVKYLVNKYGIQSIPVDTSKELNALCDGHVPLVVDNQDRLQLSDSVPNGSRERPFTMKALTHLENRITGQEVREKLQVVLKVAGAAVATAGAIAACGAGLTIPVAVSFAKAAYDDVQLVIELAEG